MFGKRFTRALAVATTLTLSLTAVTFAAELKADAYLTTDTSGIQTSVSVGTVNGGAAGSAKANVFVQGGGTWSPFTFTATPGGQVTAATAGSISSGGAGNGFESTISWAAPCTTGAFSGTVTYTAPESSNLSPREVVITVNGTVGTACVSADATAPTSTAAGTKADSSSYSFDSWTNQNVTVSLDATDNAGGSGVKHLTYRSAAGSAQTVSQTTVLAANLPNGPAITTEGTTTIEFWAEDNQSNVESPAKTAVVKIDKTAPTSTPDFTDGAVFQLGDTLPTVGCTDSDNLSGVASGGTPSGPTGSGTTNANGVGTFTYSCNGATDNAGNIQSTAGTKSFSVQYDLTGVGIRQPINPDNSSLFSRGKAVPVKFALNGDNPYVMTGWKLLQQQVNCSVAGEDIGTSVEAVAENPSNSFRYDSGQYIYNASFKDKAVGTCWKAGVELDSGQKFWSAIFKLQK